MLFSLESPMYRSLASLEPFCLEGEESYSLTTLLQNDKDPARRWELNSLALPFLLTKGHLMGDITLLRGLNRAATHEPYAPFPQTQTPKDTWLKDLETKLELELLKFVESRQTVLILLSGGLDSRIAAGLLRRLQGRGDFKGHVLAATWGLPNSRDVRYAEEISRRYAWDFWHIPVSAELLWENLLATPSIGAEVSGFHLHGMPLISKRKDVDVIIAGSYGDGLGRGEYSGKKFFELSPIWPENWNRNALFSKSFESSSREALLDVVRGGIPVGALLGEQVFEYQQQHHYMRRMMTGAMSILESCAPVRQIFSSPEIYSLVWGLPQNTRMQFIYEYLLPRLPSGIGSIPWARTGRPFGSLGQDSLEMDSFTSKHHLYGSWFRNDLRAEVEKLVNNGSWQKISEINHDQVMRYLKIWRSARTSSISWLDELFALLVGVSKTIDQFHLQIGSSSADRGFQDALAQGYGCVYNYVKVRARNVLRD